MLQANTVLSRRYQIISELGAGGMGEVYKAKDLRLEREVAIKVLPQHLANDHQALARFEREAKSLASLSHPNILSIHDFGTQDGISFAVMELLKGETLKSHSSSSKLTWEESVSIAISIAEGLTAAHSQGVIHRDLKPENIFLTSNGGVKVLDFGLALWNKPASGVDATSAPTESQLTKEGAVMGTIPYMSPEQLHGDTVDARSDLFSFGTIFYEMLTGTHPFSGKSYAEVIASILKEEPHPIVTPKHCPAGVIEVALHCLRKNPAERFQTSRDLTDALKAVIGGTSGRTAPYITRSMRAPRFSWRFAVIAAVAIAVAVLSGLLFFGRKSVHSIAVLPFENSSRDPDAEYVSDGVTENLINTLSRLPRVRVMARGTVFVYKNKNVDPRQVGRDLHVETVVTGRIYQKDKHLSISTEMVKVSDGSSLWGQQYSDRNAADLLDLQTEISHEIIEHLRLNLSDENQKAIEKRYTTDNEAYQFFLRARYHWVKDTPEDYEKASEYYNEAIKRDPNFALAYAGLAEYYTALALHGILPPKEAWDKFRPPMEKALQLDRDLVESTGATASYDLFAWNFAAAEKSIRRGLQLSPQATEQHRFYGEFLRAMGRFDESITQLKQAQELDPLSVTVNKSLGVGYFWAKRYDEALAQLQKTIDLDPNSSESHDALADVYVRKGNYPGAIDETAQYLKLSGDEEEATAFRQLAEKSGYPAAIQSLYEKQLKLLESNSQYGYVSPMFFVFVNAHLGRKDEAFRWLDEAFRERSPWLIFLKTDPQFDTLRSDPRFMALMKKVGLI
jgi:serine/threonine-protein kinase